ncbi:MAG: hypothetical protein LBK61_14415 [Spirochaetaceae bacterium]|nr:hypothetical protein [Spirochaetaceae bacterium]
MKNKYRISLITGVLVCLLFSCEQYAIFDSIAKEIKPKPALIKGTPSKIVEGSGGKLYVANGDLWEYSGDPDDRWSEIPASSGVRDVATVGSDVYIISVGNSPSLSKLDGGTISVPETVQGIFGANNTLFIATGSDNSYSVYKYDGNSPAQSIGVVSGLLHGAAYYNDGTVDHYYLATSEGLYHSTDGSSFSSIDTGKFLGVIALTDKAVAVTGSTVYEVVGETPPTQSISVDSLTGALAVSGDMLYLGRTRGYRTIDTNAADWESKTPTTTNYTSTIAQVQVVSMYAVSNDLIFSSVRSSEPKQSGLMSLREDSWNMEE